MGKLQNEDHKSETELIAAGGAVDQLLNDSKVYVSASGINKRLDQAIVDGDIGGGAPVVQTVNFVDRQTINAIQPFAGNNLLDRNTIKFPLASLNDAGESILSISNAGSYTEFTALVDCVVDVSAYARLAVSGAELRLSIAGGEIITASDNSSAANAQVTLSGEFRLTAGQAFRFDAVSGAGVSNDGARFYLNISAEANSQQVATSTQDILNTFSARIQNNGTVSIISQGPVDFIQSVTRSSTGVLSITWIPGFFTVAPGLADSNSSGGALRNLTFSAELPTGCNLTTSNQSILSDFDFTITATRQDEDAKDPTQTVAIATSLVTYLKDVKTTNTAGGSASAATIQTRVLNTQEGNLQFCSLSSNEFTLTGEAGESIYDIEFSAPAYECRRHQAQIYNVTAGSVSIVGSSERTSSGAQMNTRSIGQGRVTITADTTFDLRHYTEQVQASNGLGNQSGSGEDEVYSIVKITKVK